MTWTCFHLGVGTGIAISVTVAALFGWLFIVIAESDWHAEEEPK